MDWSLHRCKTNGLPYWRRAQSFIPIGATGSWFCHFFCCHFVHWKFILLNSTRKFVSRRKSFVIFCNEIIRIKYRQTFAHISEPISVICKLDKIIRLLTKFFVCHLSDFLIAQKASSVNELFCSFWSTNRQHFYF